MAHSKLSVPSLGTPQHFLECGIKNCERNCQYYCNACHQMMCEQCREEHLKNPEYKNHEVVLYQQRKRQLPVEKCNIHPTKDIDMLCEECQIPLCSKCATQAGHRGHKFIDLETIFEEKMVLCLGEISKIQEYFIPTSQDLQKEIKVYTTEIKMIMDSLRTAMKADGESLKSMVDTVVSENMQQVDKIEQSLLGELQSQDTAFDDYISYLRDLIKDFHSCLFSPKLTNIISKLSEKFPEIGHIPETTKPVTPMFTAGQYSKDDVAKLLGKIKAGNKKSEMRKIKPMEIVSPSKLVDYASKQKKRDKDKESDEALPVSSSVTVVREMRLSLIELRHISLDKSGKLWVSDSRGNLVQIDLHGNQLLWTKILSFGQGVHTVTQDGILILTDYSNKVINKMTQNNKFKMFIKTGDWAPISIHSSNINGDILVGMEKGGWKDKEAKVTRYSKTGKELQNIQKDDRGRELYRLPIYITENINGDICISDKRKMAVVVVSKSGQHRFSYTGQTLRFYPSGICTDDLGHILVCDQSDLHLLNQDGQFLSLSRYGLEQPICVCVDKENNAYVGELYTSKVKVCKYL